MKRCVSGVIERPNESVACVITTLLYQQQKEFSFFLGNPTGNNKCDIRKTNKKKTRDEKKAPKCRKSIFGRNLHVIKLHAAYGCM